ncbi:16S rRNA (guanine(527)-N(7))-methyltransferase RsmG [Pseudohoeflea suaedae]|uniref:Ribosomal RNA small subunit methyltransferase G n=1 Tax=Pseudohoeflea suaedae TaxID=877384 RepID=A0A4R5PLQ5_9HYPH|nr:16S rRNA (guanine(527)-N(7))-methyltransferase RsmG [Pseudohoeflea suaedae]TDH37809.1 16S rRNA (guanine(527)-N(7))-methyltransferase RsmG [Pseudohoeflea suaedae]
MKPQNSGDSRFVSRETRDRLKTYESLVRKWQKSINLVAPSTLDELWSRHIEDSLQLFALTPEPKVWADLGSGAGFPGLVTAICLAEAGEGWVHLIESNNKKAAFLRTAITETGARASVHPARIEAAIPTIDQPQAISARALSSLDELLAFVEPVAKRNPTLECWFHKGFGYRDEVAIARGNWQFDLVEHPSRVLDGSVILQVRQLEKIGAGKS